jgi:WD40 repeat protein
VVGIGVLAALSELFSAGDEPRPPHVIIPFPGLQFGTVAISPDGKLLAAPRAPRVGEGIVPPQNPVSVGLYDLATGREVAELKGPPTGGWRVAFSDDGRTLACVGLAFTIKLWDVPSRKEGESVELGVHLLSLGFSPDLRTVATSAASSDVVHVRDIARGKVLATLASKRDPDAPPMRVSALAFSPDGKRLAATYFREAPRGSPDKKRPAPVVFYPGEVRVWDLGSQEIVAEFQRKDIEPQAVTWSPDGGTLAYCFKGETVRLWNASTGKERQSPGDFRPESLQFSPDGKWLGGCGRGKEEILLWDLFTDERKKVLTDGSWIRAFCFSADNKTVIAVGTAPIARGFHPNIHIWDVPRARKPIDFERPDVIPKDLPK